MPPYRYSRVFIAEKPSAARALAPFLKPGEIVLAAEGHLLAQKTPDQINPAWKTWSPDNLPILIEEIPLEIGKNRGGKPHHDKIKAMAEALRQTEVAVDACDSGREGSLIAWEILEHVGYRGKVQRLHLEAMDDASIREALAKMDADPRSGERDYCVYQEGLARSHDDYHQGMNGSRALSIWLKPPSIQGAWTYGGVMTPTLGLLTDRELAIRNFVPTDFFKIAMAVDAGAGRAVTLIHNPKEHITDRAAADTIRDLAARWQGPLKVEQALRRRSPPKLFNLNSLQRRAAKLFGWTPTDTERFAQSLYESGYTTYPRTETSFLKLAEADKAPAVLAAIAQACPSIAGLVPAPDAILIRKGSVYKDASSEHFAIVPTAKVPDLQALNPQEARLYDLVARYYLANHLPDAVDAVTRITAKVVDNGKEHDFAVRGSVEHEAGWRRAFQKDQAPGEDDDKIKTKASDDDEPVSSLPPIKDQEHGQATNATLVTAQTKPPPRITLGELPSVMARLIDLIEDPTLKAALHNPATPDEPKGLGAASSRKDIAPKLLKRFYIETLPGKDPPLRVTDIGLALIKALREHHPKHANPVARAVFESELGKIGSAATVQDAEAAALAFREKTFSAVQEMVDKLRTTTALDVQAHAPARGYSGRHGGRDGSRRFNGGSRRPPSGRSGGNAKPSYPAPDPATFSGMTPLNVPYERREEAKALGARWNPGNKRWMIASDNETAKGRAREKGFL